MYDHFLRGIGETPPSEEYSCHRWLGWREFLRVRLPECCESQQRAPLRDRRTLHSSTARGGEYVESVHVEEDGVNEEDTLKLCRQRDCRGMSAIEMKLRLERASRTSEASRQRDDLRLESLDQPVQSVEVVYGVSSQRGETGILWRVNMRQLLMVGVVEVVEWTRCEIRDPQGRRR
ncbi:hypothetical protein Tco_0954415 [Tanacetum coccineum]|uniref:Uncharacterized protein n=1 Tax=Tanacetum coccineum TaxID=301880 RepID=A0ABQ5E2P8_9ASTR